MAVTAMAVLATATADTARGLLTLRPMPTTAMADMVDTVLVPMEAMAVTAMAVTAMAVLATATAATARGPLTLRLMPTTATAVLVMVLDMVDMVVMPAMAAMAMA